MVTGLLKRIFGSRNERLLRQYSQTVRAINALEADTAKLSDTDLKAKTAQFKQRYANGETLDHLLPEAFAVVREASRRVLQMRHFDVQMIGGIALHQGKIGEMRTGEGKTLVATLPAYLNALSGKGVHVVTVNDYLAKRDSEWMGRVYRFLDLTVGVILSQMDHADKQGAYGADITYGTNNEFGFDYLRDNMASAASERFQRHLNYAIVDEVDSILIDEARTPLIISGQAEDTTELYYRMNEIAPRLTRQKDENSDGDYSVDEKQHQVLLSEAGHERAEALLAEAGLLPHGGSLYDPSNINLMHHLYAALRATSLYHRDQNYVVQDDEVIIVDEFTGRLMPGRRWSDGLHQAVEAKEGVSIQRENQTLASITFQNYFRMYNKLSGMTGTADTEAYEFQQIYTLETVVIPTHNPMVRDDRMDQVYQTAAEKYAAVIKDIKECHAKGQPVLVGTTSIENSELVSKMLEKEKLTHNVLNAKQHAREAEIVTQAGRINAITIATNMAGRGTDIVLGGNPEPEISKVNADEKLDEAAKQKRVEQIRHDWQALHNQVVAAGGLHIIATERHESRRIDNQLRGRAGRQGDPGSSRFYLSLEDPLLRIFASERVASIMQRLKMPEGEAIEHPWVTRAIENAQRKVEARNFDMRKHLLEYDDVANDQRKAIYESRNQLLESADISERVTSIRREVLNAFITQHIPPESLEEQWDIDGLEKTLLAELQISLPLKQWLADETDLDEDKLRERVIEHADRKYQEKIASLDAPAIRQFERSLMLQSIDSHWREHLAALDHLRQGIHLRSYAQKTPAQEYKKEAFELFGLMLEMINTEVTRILLTVQFRSEAELQKVEEPAAPTNLQFHHADHEQALEEANADADAAAPDAQTFVRRGQKVGRNDACPCGSGKKYKYCHGKLV
jgi:preprotein translocase subunit SecA